MNTPESLKYTKSHEWVLEKEGDTVRIGITDYAQDQMGDIVFVDLPAVGDILSVGEMFANIESVKAVSDVFSPVSGTVSAINEALLDAPESINSDPYDAWIVEVSEVSDREDFMSAEEYTNTCDAL